MATGGSGAVFFLDARVHYKVLNQPEYDVDRYDVENGNTSTETIYHNETVQEMWSNDQIDSKSEMDNKDYGNERGNWNYCELSDATVTDEKDIGNEARARSDRSPSETALCEQDGEMKPATLNALADNATPKSKPRSRVSFFSFLSSLGRRKRRLDTDQVQYLQHIESVLTTCTHRESCRCLECQSSYFDCDESDYSSDESEYTPHYVAQAVETREDDEVFLDSVPGDNTSTDLLIDNDSKPECLENPEMSVSSDDGGPDCMDLEVAAGTPVLLNYLLTHPITCVIL